MIGEKEQMESVIELSGHPNKIDVPKEKKFFRRLLAFIAPWAVKARNITEDYYKGEADRRKNEAEKFSAETAEIAAKTELVKLEKIKLENELIDQVFSEENPSPQSMLKMANILANNPSLIEQMEKVKNMMNVLKAVNFTQIDISIEANNETSNEDVSIVGNPHRKAAMKQGVFNEKKRFDAYKENIRSLLKTKLVDFDLSVRVLNVLKTAEIDTLGDLVLFNKNDLLKLRNFNKKHLKELEALVDSKQLSFGMDLFKYGLDLE